MGSADEAREPADIPLITPLLPPYLLSIQEYQIGYVIHYNTASSLPLKVSPSLRALGEHRDAVALDPSYIASLSFFVNVGSCK
jgi:hypothetical protein